jgi:hypothetical protein
MSLEGKLGLKDRPIRVVGAPEGFRLATKKTIPGESALLVFVTNRATLEGYLKTIAESAAADRLTWVAYPKGGQLETDLNRDSLARVLIAQGVRPVTQISIDSTWSALRFRPGKVE